MTTTSEPGDGMRLSPTEEKLLPVITRAAIPRSVTADPWGLLRWGKYCGSSGGDYLRLALHTLPFVLLLALVAVASTFVLGGFDVLQQPIRQSLIIPLSVSKMSSPFTAATLAASSAADSGAFDGSSSKLEPYPSVGGAEAESTDSSLTEASVRGEANEETHVVADESVADLLGATRSSGKEWTGELEKGKKGPSEGNGGGVRESAAAGVTATVVPSIETPPSLNDSPADSIQLQPEDSQVLRSQVEEEEPSSAGPPDATVASAERAFAVVTEGDLSSRLSALCAAPSIAAVLAARNSAHQPGQRKGMTVLWNGGSDVFGGLPGSAEIRAWAAAEAGKGEAGKEKEGSPLQKVVDSWPELSLIDEDSDEAIVAKDAMMRLQVSLPPCTSSGSQQGWSQELWVGKELGLHMDASAVGDVALTPSESCTARRLEAACLGGLQPSPAVAAMMLSLPATSFTTLQHSTAVYLEAGAALPPAAAASSAAEDAPAAVAASCGGCSDDPLLNCTIRTLAWRYLRAGSTPPVSSSPHSDSPGSSFIVAAFEPESAAAVAGSFHPSRAPLLLPLTHARLGRCSASASSSTPSSSSSPQSSSARRLLQNPPSAPTPAEAAGTSAAAAAAKDAAAAAAGLDVTLREGDSNEWSCVQLQVAEMWVLSAAAGLIHTHASPEARFMAAQATASTARRMLKEAIGAAEEAGRADVSRPFVLEPSVCEAPPADTFTGRTERFLRQFIVDESLKTIYCFVPKVACTSWKTWFRQQQGQGSNISDVYLTHDHYKSGLRILAYHYKEHQVIRLLTRPDFFKFSFIRNPYARLASVYFNKHVNGGPPFGRQFWNKMFFRNIGAYRRLVEAQEGKDLFRFSDFAYLLRTVENSKRSYMESHVQPQMDVCRFDAIKFDFIGRFESLDADVEEVLRHLNRTDASGAFSIGLNAHRTNAEDKLALLYDERAFTEASQLYASDFNIPLNNISYAVPDGLAKKFKTASAISIGIAAQPYIDGQAVHGVPAPVPL